MGETAGPVAKGENSGEEEEDKWTKKLKMITLTGNLLVSVKIQNL